MVVDKKFIRFVAIVFAIEVLGSCSHDCEFLVVLVRCEFGLRDEKGCLRYDIIIEKKKK